MKVVDIDRVVILMRFIQIGWDEERKKRFDEDLRIMLETQAIDTKQIRADAIEEFCEGYKNFQTDEKICNLQEDCSFSGGWCIDCFKDKWLKEQK